MFSRMNSAAAIVMLATVAEEAVSRLLTTRLIVATVGDDATRVTIIRRMFVMLTDDALDTLSVL